MLARARTVLYVFIAFCLAPAAAHAVPFRPVQPLGLTGNVNDVVTGDLAPGPEIDAAAATDSGLVILPNSGLGYFNATHVYAGNYTAVAAADMNGDGTTDLITGSDLGNGSGEVDTWLNAGDGRFEFVAGEPLPAPPSRIAAAKVDGDAFPDAIIAIPGTNPVLDVGFNNGHGVVNSLSTHALPGPTTGLGMAVGDANGDLLPDVIVAGDSKVDVLKGDGTDLVDNSSHDLNTVHPVDFAALDLDGDGILDLRWVGSDGGLGQQLGLQSSPYWSCCIGNFASLPGAGSRIVSLRRAWAPVAFVESATTGLYWNTGAVINSIDSTATKVVAAADLDGDGVQDFVAAGPDNHFVAYISSAEATPDHTSLTFASQPQGTLSAGQTVVFTDTGYGTMKPRSITLSGPNADDFVLADDSCTGASISYGLSCEVRVKFAPLAPGARGATLTLNYTQDLQGPTASVSLSGTGGSLPTGATGSAGADGATGPAGPAGPGGVTGPAGATGPKGADGKTPTVLTCKKKGKTFVCRATKFAAATARARLSRHGRVVARGAIRRGTLRLRARRALRHGAYVLTLVAGRTTIRMPARV